MSVHIRGDKAKGGVPAVNKALDILEAITGSRDGWMGVSELSQLLDMPKSTIHSILNTMRVRGYIEQDPVTRKYGLGVRHVELGSAYRARAQPFELFPTIARQINRECDETVYLAVLDGKDVVYLAKVESSLPLRMAAREGTRFPAHLTALGKSLLSGLTDDELDALYDEGALPARTANSIAILSELKAQLAEVRARRYSRDQRESTEDVECVAAPVQDATGQVIAAISIALPSSRMTPERFEKLRDLILAGAAEISHRLGASHMQAADPRNDSHRGEFIT